MGRDVSWRMPKGWIPADEWRTIVANVPVVSVDLPIRTDEGLLFGTRTNEPAEWSGSHRVAVCRRGRRAKTRCNGQLVL